MIAPIEWNIIIKKQCDAKPLFTAKVVFIDPHPHAEKQIICKAMSTTRSMFSEKKALFLSRVLDEIIQNRRLKKGYTINLPVYHKLL